LIAHVRLREQKADLVAPETNGYLNIRYIHTAIHTDRTSLNRSSAQPAIPGLGPRQTIPNSLPAAPSGPRSTQCFRGSSQASSHAGNASRKQPRYIELRASQRHEKTRKIIYVWQRLIHDYSGTRKPDSNYDGRKSTGRGDYR
jgi:hypothetical protein